MAAEIELQERIGQKRREGEMSRLPRLANGGRVARAPGAMLDSARAWLRWPVHLTKRIVDVVECWMASLLTPQSPCAPAD
jgi:hypothetical protein